MATSGLVACSGGEDGASEPVPEVNSTPAVTEVAGPTGAPAGSTVGAAGGSVTSADGKLTLEFPPGALAADTEVSITPVGNVAPGSVVSYRLEPEGVQFEEPVTLRFTLAEEELRGTTPEALRIATQTTAGTWRVLPEAARESDGLSATTTHFSDYSLLFGWQIRPAEAHVKTDRTVDLQVTYCALTEAELDDEVVPLAAECQGDQGLTPFLANASVNGTKGGSAEVGRIAQDESRLVYTAPSEIPDSNPVAVSVEVGLPGKRATVVSNLRVTADAPPYTGVVSFVTQYENYTVEARADVTWEVERASNASVKYVPVGTVHATYTQTSPPCQPVEGTYPIERGDLVVHPKGAAMFAEQYTFNLEATPDIMVTCTAASGETFTTAAQAPIYVQVGMCDGATLPTYSDENLLAGSGACPVVFVTSSTWEFRRSE